MDAVVIVLAVGLVVAAISILALQGWCHVLSARIDTLSQRITILEE